MYYEDDSYDNKSEYRIYPELRVGRIIMDHGVSVIDYFERYNTLCGTKSVKSSHAYSRPHMKAYLEKRLTESFDNDRCASVHRFAQRTFGDVGECPGCLINYLHSHADLRKINVSGKILKKIIWDADDRLKLYANPNMVDEIKNVTLDESVVKEICLNPCGVSFIEQNPHLITDNCRPNLAKNKAAESLIITHGVREFMKNDTFVSDSENYWPHLNMDYCRAVLKEDITKEWDMGIVTKTQALSIIRNPCSKALVRECISSLIDLDDYKLIVLCIMPQHIELIEEFEEQIFTREINIRVFNLNPAAVNFIKNNRSYIRYLTLAYNKYAWDIIEPKIFYVLEIIGEEDRESFLNMLNRNPAAVPFLRKYPELVRSTILYNPNIFERIN